MRKKNFSPKTVGYTLTYSFGFFFLIVVGTKLMIYMLIFFINPIKVKISKKLFKTFMDYD